LKPVYAQNASKKSHGIPEGGFGRKVSDRARRSNGNASAMRDVQGRLKECKQNGSQGEADGVDGRDSSITSRDVDREAYGEPATSSLRIYTYGVSQQEVMKAAKKLSLKDQFTLVDKILVRLTRRVGMAVCRDVQPALPCAMLTFWEC
jgi:hypothetical protein